MALPQPGGRSFRLHPSGRAARTSVDMPSRDRPQRESVATLLEQGVFTQHTKLKAGVRRHSFWKEVSAIPVAKQFPLRLYKKLGPVPQVDESSCVVSPLKVNGMDKWLFGEPGLPYLRKISVHGADLLYRGPRQHVIRGNHPSALIYSRVVEKYLTTGLSNNGIAAVDTMEELQKLCGSKELIISPMGVVPKEHVPLVPSSDKGRVITDSSFGGDASLNAHIDTSDFPTVDLDRLDALTRQMRKLRRLVGKNEPLYLAKVDVSQAFRTIPVRRQDWWLQGKTYTFPRTSTVVWSHVDGLYGPPSGDVAKDVRMAGKTIWATDISLAFGGRSSPIIYCMFSNAIRDALRRGKTGLSLVLFIVQYVDDSGILGTKGGKYDCQTAVDTLVQALQDCGFKVQPAKFEAEGAPSRQQVFLGIMVDLIRMEYRVPEDKLQRARSLAREWRHRKSGVVRDLLSVIGTLGFCASVIRPGRLFLRRLYDLTGGVPVHKHVHLTREARLDLAWWANVLDWHNGVAAIPTERARTCVDLDMATDASDIGYGGYWGNEYFHGVWEHGEELHSINIRELYAIVVAVELWGERWRGKRVILHSDSQVSVDVITNWSAARGLLCRVLRRLHFAMARAGCEVVVKHVAGVDNVGSDHLSRDRVHEFLTLRPNAVRVQSEGPLKPMLDASHEAFSYLAASRRKAPSA